MQASSGFLLAVLRWPGQCVPEGMSTLALRLGGNALLEVGMLRKPCPRGGGGSPPYTKISACLQGRTWSRA